MAGGLLQDLPRDLPTFSSVSAPMRRAGPIWCGRWPAGLGCDRCGHDQAYSHKKRLIEECRACGKQHSILAGTIFEQTKTGLARWFLAIYLVTASKGGISAMELQRQMGFAATGPPGRGCTRSDAPWSCRAASRSASGSRPTRPWSAARGPAGPAAARRARRWSPARSRAGAARPRAPARPAAAPAGARCRAQQPGRLSRPERPEPRQVPTYGGRAIAGSRPGLRPRADPARPVLGRRRAPPAGDPPGVGLAKRWLLGTHHGAVSAKHLQAYLDEYVFRFNRRTAKSIAHHFARLIEQAVLTPPTTYRAISHGNA